MFRSIFLTCSRVTVPCQKAIWLCIIAPWRRSSSLTLITFSALGVRGMHMWERSVKYSSQNVANILFSGRLR